MHMNLLPGIDLGDLDARAPATASAFAVGRRTPSFRDGNGRERSTIQKKTKTRWTAGISYLIDVYSILVHAS